MIDEIFIQNKISKLKTNKNISEYQMSLDLGKSRGYIQQITSGRSLPSMSEFLKICNYFEISPLEFFDSDVNNPALVKKATDKMKKLDDDDIILLINIINRLSSEKEAKQKT